MLPNQKPIDHWLMLRKAWVAHLIANAPVAGLVTVEKIWGEKPPANIKWPFIRIGNAITTPYVATRQNGSSHRLTTHVFAKGSDTNDVSRIAAEVVDLMEGFSIPSLDLVDRQWVGTNVLRDTDETDAWHAAIDFDLIVVQTI